MNKVVYFRVDGNTNIGIAHILRCKTLANHLKLRNIKSVFIVRYYNNDILDRLASFHTIIIGHELELIDIIEGVGVIIFDISHRYTLSNLLDLKLLIEKVYQLPIKTILFDGSTQEDCIHKKIYTKADYIIIPYFGIEKDDYNIANENEFLFGLKYFIFQEQVINELDKGNNRIKFDILVTMGGGDPSSMTIKVLEKLLEKNYTIKALITNSFDKMQIRKMRTLALRNKKIELLNNIKNIAKLITASRLVVTSTGLTKYECFVLKKRSILVSSNNKLKSYHKKLEKHSDTNILYVGELVKKNSNIFKNKVRELLACDKGFDTKRMEIDLHGSDRILNIVSNFII